MPYLSLQFSPLVPGVSPVPIFYRESGEGTPLIFLHGGWGYGLYPFDRQIEALQSRCRIVIPDRSGYGRSTRLVEDLPPDFHYRAAAETLCFLDSLGIERAIFWGHSDGAVIAAIIGFTAPERIAGLILEAFHYYALKPRSREFFEALANRPEAVGSELCAKFAREFGAEYWRQLITTHAKAWLQIGRESSGPDDDLYAGRLREISARTLFIHGRLDPRTEPGELDAVRRQLPHCEMWIFDDATHSPHSERASADQVTSIASKFLEQVD